ncbi:MAG: hypothetical protein DRP87_01140 [Spirochaetes bacterium]|nr:MAG: hypothetical protein DRP87_01140 [Spirochaetota bacterium]
MGAFDPINRIWNIPLGKWFHNAGAEYDTVISSRVRLSRNLGGYCFPWKMLENEKKEVEEKVLRALSGFKNNNSYQAILLKELNQTERKILLERNMISSDYSTRPEKFIIIDRTGNTCGVVNEVDHLRIAGFRGGMDILGAYEDVDRLDSELEQELDYAVSLEWGYLNAEVVNTGTGMKASVMLHLPSLVSTSLIGKVFNEVNRVGYSVKGFWGSKEHSLGNIYQISNSAGMGVSEKEIIEKLENITLQVVNYERKAREEMLRQRRVEVEDRVFRAYGILTNCRSISSSEAIELIGALRAGVALGILDLPLELITSLLILTQKAHIQYLLESREAGVETGDIDFVRAKMIRESIGSLSV